MRPATTSSATPFETVMANIKVASGPWLTTTDLAAISGVPEAHLRDCAKLTLPEVESLAEVLDVDPFDLLLPGGVA